MPKVQEFEQGNPLKYCPYASKKAQVKIFARLKVGLLKHQSTLAQQDKNVTVRGTRESAQDNMLSTAQDMQWDWFVI